MATIAESIHDVYERHSTNYARYAHYNDMHAYWGEYGPSFMEIPLQGDRIEIPVLANDFVRNARIKYPDIEEVVVSLNHTGLKHSLTTVDGILKNSINISMTNWRLFKAETKEKGIPYVFYFTGGAIFSPSLQPYMMCSWLYEKDEDGNLIGVKPLLRVARHTFLNKSTPVEKYICNKILPIVAGELFRSHAILYDREFCASRPVLSAEIIIGDFPFTIRTPRTPDSHTSEKLVQTAIEHFDQIVCQ